ncbi:polysaccharide biosynthesis/export family protein [Marinicellulosiphila megalodicopiae]|uniref:polysaccharide biosynthesis/export family protein n=1 Tax=Marinicellulosiphila megalodicopiae TaxID=2724896 RepID=UPI003BAE16C1
MQALRLIILTGLSIFAGLCFSQDNETANLGYKLGQGDKIIIKIFGQDDLTLETQLNDSGTINYPFLGSLIVQGLTVEQTEALIYNGLKGDYIVEPNVFVGVVEYRPFYIHGQVNRAGGYAYQPGMTLSQAIALAGGLTERGSKEKIFITRESKVTAIQAGSFDTPIRAGDTIIINQRFF